MTMNTEIHTLTCKESIRHLHIV